ncbi:hypothetical protein Tco_0421464, partial [Tanacetum coccineum]
IQQAAARSEKWVPFTERVKISSTNIRLETIVPEKEEIFQVVIDLIKNSTRFKAFTISADVLEIFMQQFWYTIKKVQGTDSYEFLLANKKCTINADVFRKILDICPKVEGVNFIELPDDDATLAFLIELGYKGPIYKHTNMFVDHMHQPRRTLAAIINKCLSGKTASNDKLRKSRIDILWGILITRRRRDQDVKICHFPDSPKSSSDHFLKQHKSLSKLKYQHYHTIKDDGIVSRLKFVRTGEDYQEYGLPIPDVMLTDAIKQSESYQMFIKYSTGQIPPKKNRGKGPQGKKTIDTPVTDIDVFEESEPEPARKRTTSKIRVKKKAMISADDNIIPDQDVALELGKSISLTEAEEEEAARQVHATHARICSTPKEQEVADTMKALKESRKTIIRQPGSRGSSEGTGSKPGVPDESTIVSATSSEGTGAKPGVLNEEKVTTKEKVIFEWGSEQEKKKDDTHDDKSIDLEMTDDEETKDEFVHGEEQVNDDEDEEMTNAKVVDSDKDDEEVTDAAKADAKKTSEVKDDAKKTELPPTSSSLSVSSGFGDQFLKLSSDTSLVGTVKDTTDVEINSVLEVKIQSKVPHIQSPSILRVTVSVISKPPVLTLIQETPSATPVTTLPHPSVSTIPHLKIIDHSAEALATLLSQVSTIVDDYLGSRLSDALQKALHKHSADLTQKHSVKPALESSKIQIPTINLEQESKKIILEILKIKEQGEKQKMPKYTIKSTDKAALKEYDLKSALYQTMHANKSFNRNPANHRLYYALMEALIEDENAMDKGVDDTTKRRRTKESESSKKPSATKETPKGKAPSKGSKTGKSVSANELVEEPIAKVVMNDVGEDKVHDDDQPQDTSEPKTD